jgi:hypothetical protein
MFTAVECIISMFFGIMLGAFFWDNVHRKW